MQSNLARALVALAAIVVVVVAFFVLRGDDEAGEGSSNGAATAEQTTTEQASGGGSKPAGEKDNAGKPEEPAVPEIVVAGGRPEGGVADLEFEKGDEVRFVVRSDTADEIHVHGYDVYADVPAGGKAEVEFPAEIDGIFEVELHDSAAQIAELTVSP